MTDANIRSEARRLEILSVFALIGVIVAITVRYLLLPGVEFARGPMTPEAFTETLGAALISVLPVVLFAGALSATHRLAGRLHRGELFSTAVGQGVTGIGSSLVAGAVAAAFIVPNLLAVVQGDYDGFGFKLDAETWVIGIVGLALMLVGRLLGRAGEMKAELESYV